MSLIDNLWIKIFAKQVGVDQFGNKYFIGKSSDYLGKKRRFVTYNGIEDASKIPSLWHAWLHYLSNDLPQTNQITYSWQKNHIPNLTGTKHAYDFTKSSKQKSSYARWTPSNNSYKHN